MTRIIAGIVAVVVLVSTALAQESGGTKFRGLSLDMTMDEVKKQIPDGFKIYSMHEEQRCTLSREEELLGQKVELVCAILQFDSNQPPRVESMSFKQRFFELGAITLKEFAQVIIAHYPIKEFDFETKRVGDEYLILSYTGELSTGERARVTGLVTDRSGDIYEIAFTVARQKGKF